MAMTLQRQWQLLRLVPRLPAKTGTRELTRQLKAAGFKVSQRSVQRDLAQLAQIFPDLINDGDKDIPGWSWRRESELLELPRMDAPLALTFQLAERFLKDMIPATVLAELKPYFSRARQVLNNIDETGFNEWSDRVRIIPRTQPLLPAPVEPDILSQIQTALLRRKQFRGRYRRRDGDEAEYLFHPLGLIFRNSVVYLVACVWDYDDVRHYALHRFVEITPINEPAREPNNFSMDAHLATGVAEYADPGAKHIKLVARFDPYAVQHLRETPLSEDQRLKELNDGRVELRATVLSTWQLRWWLLGFGGQVEVVGPKGLREEFTTIAEELAGHYTPAA
ncbi:MAG: helix-turn-helix transcriptional regulator [Pseudomonadota bacterium]